MKRLALALIATAALFGCSQTTDKPIESLQRITYDGDTVRIEFTDGPTVTLTKDATLQLHQRLAEMLSVVGPGRDQPTPETTSSSL